MIGARRHTKEAGYALLELVVASAPFAVIGLSLLAVLGFTVAFSLRGQASVEAIEEGRLALDAIAEDVREASTAPGAIRIWSRDEGAAQDAIGVLVARDENAGRSFLTAADGTPRWQHAVFYIHDPDGGDLRRIATEPAPLVRLAAPPPVGPGRRVAQHIKRLRIARQDDLITMTLTVGKSPAETTLQTTVRPRN